MRIWERWRTDRGYSTVEALIILPLTLLLLALILQVTSYLLAVQAAQTAAHKGALAAAAWESSPAEGTQRAEDWLARGLPARVLDDVSVSSAGSTADSVRITVSGSASSVLGWTMTIQESAVQPVEDLP